MYVKYIDFKITHKNLAFYIGAFLYYVTLNSFKEAITNHHISWFFLFRIPSFNISEFMSKEHSYRDLL